MLADFFTKPLQGGLVRKFRSVILGHEHTSTLMNAPVPMAEERVGIQRPSVQGREHVSTGTVTGVTQKQMVVKQRQMPEGTKEQNGAATKVTWADVVRGSTANKAPEVKNNGFVSRSFSRNNPVNKNEV
jgi:hypothetical protein